MRHTKNKIIIMELLIALSSVLVILVVLFIIIIGMYERKYAGRIYPNVLVGGIPFGGETKEKVASYWQEKNRPFVDARFELRFESTIATISGSDLDLGYDANLSATQAYLIGRSGGLLSNLNVLFFQRSVDLEPYFRWKKDVLEDALNRIADQVNIPVNDGLFQFTNGKVTAFKPSHDGRQLDQKEANQRIQDAFKEITRTGLQTIVIQLPVVAVHPSITTNDTNVFGIRERIGTGYSEFQGSIPGRIHNVALAASRLNGVLIKPGDTFSFNDTVGDISAATGYQSAYIIKEGRTVLGDGGGVCQVSSTLFRAALNAGLSITERHAHAYRVHYYEEGGFKPGMDATVFSPSVDLKIKNDTPTYILIQTKTDTKNLTLTFELYGTRDGRKAEISNHIVWGITPAPPPLYQDDPTLKIGATKQVDWAATGAKASFQYKVTRNGESLQDTTFYSNFRPWQAVYLKGTLQ